MVAKMVKNLPSMQETWVHSLGWEDPLGKGMTTHSSILAWTLPWIEKPAELQFMELQSQTAIQNTAQITTSQPISMVIKKKKSKQTN